MKTPNANALVKAGVELDRHYAFVYVGCRVKLRDSVYIDSIYVLCS